MRVLLVTWSGGGNVGPTVELGRRLVAAGHSVEAFGPPGLAERFRAARVGYLARGASDTWDPLPLAVDARRAIERSDADVVVVDYMLPSAICAAISIDRPVVALVHTLYGALLVDGAPAPMSVAVSVEDVNEVRTELGLAQVDRLGDVLDEADTVVVAAPPELDLVPERLPAHVRYVGPLREGTGPDEGWEPPGGDGPLVVVSMGTTPMDEGPVLQGVLDALADVPVRVIAQVPDHIDPGVLSFPPNTTPTGYVRHAAVMPHADVAVSHGGLGTIVAALAHAVPSACVPLGRDQPVNAAAVQRAGAGIVVPPPEVGDRLAAAVADLLENPRHREGAAALAGAIAERERSVDLVAEVLYPP